MSVNRDHSVAAFSQHALARAPLLAVALSMTGCCCGALGSSVSEEPDAPLRELRATLRTQVFFDDTSREPAPEPPRGVLELVRYRAPLGENAAYVSPRATGRRRPAIVWIAGGFDWGIGGGAWLPAPRDNDQSARAFREAGIVLMLPSLRGSNDNPGRNECFFGEVEDVIAAADYLASRSDVDPDRIYLGAHSTGGTLALLVAASTDRFRAVLSFGPVEDPLAYGAAGCLPEDVSDEEWIVRQPLYYVDEITTPTFIVEGEVSGNADSARRLHAAREQAPVEVVLVPNMDHFSVLAPGTEVAARAILADTGPRSQLSITAGAIAAR